MMKLKTYRLKNFISTNYKILGHLGQINAIWEQLSTILMISQKFRTFRALLGCSGSPVSIFIEKVYQEALVLNKKK